MLLSIVAFPPCAGCAGAGLQGGRLLEAFTCRLPLICCLSLHRSLLFAGLQEERLLELLEGRGFAVQDVPQAQLAEEYRGGTYRVLRCTRIE